MPNMQMVPASEWPALVERKRAADLDLSEVPAKFRFVFLSGYEPCEKCGMRVAGIKEERDPTPAIAEIEAVIENADGTHRFILFDHDCGNPQ